ncbi:MAG: uroporphyrinogen-III C-methyltransferase [Pusillimonas sp.]|nr:uroporphyrinogen-III C-methyltransferase [Pusillimonas sp.]
MTESKNASQNEKQHDDKQSAGGKPDAQSGKPPRAATVKRSGKSVWPGLFVLVLLVAVALGGFVWWQNQTHQKLLGDLMAQVQRSTTASQQAGELARQAQSNAQAQAEQVREMQSSLAAMQGQLEDLDQAFQIMTDSGSDLLLLNDIDHLVSIANQQLLLGGNVANSLVALEAAQARLARANRPALASLQQTLNGDIDRLRAVATIDVSVLSRQLDQLNGLLGQAPLLVPDVAVPESAVQANGLNGISAPSNANGNAASDVVSGTDAGADSNASWLERSWDNTAGWSREAWSVIRHDLAGFFDIRRVDNEAALLISPDQATQLRQALRLRVMTAQLALMMRQPEIWRSELQAVLTALETYYDNQSSVTQRAVRQVTRLIETPVDTKLPTLSNTLESIEVLRHERALTLTQTSDQNEEAQ